ncbi:MAG: hypothetical protein LBM71_05895 [Elusimicrobiota bacterium]|jgi:hypothetical protein|nr:hypothetical protein [Elusimicrobiota bacterium]
MKIAIKIFLVVCFALYGSTAVFSYQKPKAKDKLKTGVSVLKKEGRQVKPQKNPKPAFVFRGDNYYLKEIDGEINYYVNEKDLKDNFEEISLLYVNSQPDWTPLDAARLWKRQVQHEAEVKIVQPTFYERDEIGVITYYIYEKDLVSYAKVSQYEDWIFFLRYKRQESKDSVSEKEIMAILRALDDIPISKLLER